MVMEQGASERKVVIDAGAAIKLQRLERFGGDLFTTGSVIREIKDEKARALLQTLPQELRVREPLAQDILFTKQFAKGTGDLGFLSENDIGLIALTVQLHREEGGSVRDKPSPPGFEQASLPAFDWAPSNASKPKPAPDATADGDAIAEKEDAPAGPDAQAQKEAAASENSADHARETVVSFAPAIEEIAEPAASTAPLQAEAATEVVEKEPAKPMSWAERAAAAANKVAPVPKAKPKPAEETSAAAEEFTIVGKRGGYPEVSRGTDNAEPAETEEGDEDATDSEDGSSAGEWVTDDNMHRFGLGVEPAAEMQVTCATADYSVQNVLLQMGITPLTFDGYAVRSVKIWGLVCRACFFFTRDTTKVFCPKCGNDTVQRVPIVVDQDGRANMINSGRPLRKKGSVYSIPKPQGGRAWKTIYAEDEILIGGRDRQLRHAEKVANKEQQARDPFNEDNVTRAWYQRGGNSGGKGPSGLPRMKAGLGRVNPNANNFKFKTGKKRQY
jgi:RNA-binding protein NOB1